MGGTKNIKSTSFHQYLWNSKVETMWISLIGWPHKTSNTYYVVSTISKARVAFIRPKFNMSNTVSTKWYCKIPIGYLSALLYLWQDRRSDPKSWMGPAINVIKKRQTYNNAHLSLFFLRKKRKLFWCKSWLGLLGLIPTVPIYSGGPVWEIWKQKCMQILKLRKCSWHHWLTHSIDPRMHSKS